MTKKLVWAVLSFLMVVALVLASCTTPAEKGEKQVIEGEITQEEIMVEEEEEEEEVMEEGPEMVDVTLTKTDGTTMVKSIKGRNMADRLTIIVPTRRWIRSW